MPSNWLFPLIAISQADRSNQLQEENNRIQERQAEAAEAQNQSPAVQASMSRAANIGPLSVPQSWAQAMPNTTSPELVNTVTPLDQEEGTPGYPGIPGVPLGASQTNRGNAAPKYGARPTIMARPPSGG
jgi:hypothetical protein